MVALQTGAGWHLGVIAEEMSSTVLVRFAGSVASKWYLRSLQGSRWELQDSARRHVVEKKREGGVLVHELGGKHRAHIGSSARQWLHDQRRRAHGQWEREPRRWRR